MFHAYQSTIIQLKILRHTVEDRSYDQRLISIIKISEEIDIILLIKLTLSVSYTKMMLATMLTQRTLVCQGLVSKS
jgi:hypothetical protein